MLGPKHVAYCRRLQGQLVIGRVALLVSLMIIACVLLSVGAVVLAGCLKGGAAPDLIELNLQDNPIDGDGQTALVSRGVSRRQVWVCAGCAQKSNRPMVDAVVAALVRLVPPAMDRAHITLPVISCGTVVLANPANSHYRRKARQR